MTILKPWRRKGSFIPFPLPVNVDDIAINDIDAEPLRRLCFNEGYEPLIRGAIKALTREETYMGEQEVIDNLVRQADHLQNMFSDGCTDPGIVMPSWRFVRGNGNVGWEYQYFLDDMNGNPHSLYVAMTAYIQLVGVQVDDEFTWAGGKFTAFNFAADSSSASIEVLGHTCLDTLVSFTATGEVTLADIGANTAYKDITIVSTDPGTFFTLSASDADCLEV